MTLDNQCGDPSNTLADVFHIIKRFVSLTPYEAFSHLALKFNLAYLLLLQVLILG